MISAGQCHGRLSLPGRPAAGTDPWDWWWSSFAGDALLYVGAHPENALTHWTAAGPWVSLRYDLSPLAQRTALAHEMHHLAIGGVCESRCPKNEAKVVRETCRWLLPDIEAVGQQLRQQSLQAAARTLLVPWYVLTDRLEHATPTEQQVLADVLGSVDWLADSRAAWPSVAAS